MYHISYWGHSFTLSVESDHKKVTVLILHNAVNSSDTSLKLASYRNSDSSFEIVCSKYAHRGWG